VLLEALRISDVRTSYCLATDATTFYKGLGQRLVDAATGFNALPIVHLSLHGHNEGVGLTNRIFITWQELRDALLPINQALSGRLIICMSSCYGACGQRMAMHTDRPPPFFALIGHHETAAISDLAVGFVTFYHLLKKGTSIEMAVDAMRSASGDFKFQCVYGDSVQRDWFAFLERQRFEEMQHALLAMSGQQSGFPNHLSPPSQP
jgi:hypothetical protein